MIVHMLLEGKHEEPLARVLIRHCGHEPGTVYGGKGCSYIRSKARNFMHLAHSGNGVLVLTDFMDARCSCPPEAYRRYLQPHGESVPATFLCRFMVNELESWLMADREGLADFLHIAAAKIPGNPEDERDPKETLVNLARASRLSGIREALVPPQRHGGAVGPGYSTTIARFINTKWSPGRAETNSSSLARCIRRLRAL